MSALPDKLRLAYLTATGRTNGTLADLEKAFTNLRGIPFRSENERQKLAIVLQYIEDNP